MSRCCLSLKIRTSEYTSVYWCMCDESTGVCVTSRLASSPLADRIRILVYVSNTRLCVVYVSNTRLCVKYSSMCHSCSICLYMQLTKDWCMCQGLVYVSQLLDMLVYASLVTAARYACSTPGPLYPCTSCSISKVKVPTSL